MPPAGRKAAEAAADGVPGETVDPEYVNGYQIGHQDGYQVGFADGRAEGLGEDTARLITDADMAGYRRGREDERAAKRPPLFEAGKRLCEQNFDATDEEIDAALAQLADSYQEKLSVPDLALLAGMVRRRRQAAEAQRQIALQIPRPRSEVGQEVAKRLDAEARKPSAIDSRSVTTYETVR